MQIQSHPAGGGAKHCHRADLLAYLVATKVFDHPFIRKSQENIRKSMNIIDKPLKFTQQIKQQLKKNNEAPLSVAPQGGGLFAPAPLGICRFQLLSFSRRRCRSLFHWCRPVAVRQRLSPRRCSRRRVVIILILSPRSHICVVFVVLSFLFFFFFFFFF